MIQNRLILFQNPLCTKSGIMKLLCISRYLLFHFVKDILQVTHTTQFITTKKPNTPAGKKQSW